MSSNTLPEQTSNQPPAGDGRMAFTVCTHELRAARLFMDYDEKATPGLVLSACALNARMVAHDKTSMYFQRLCPVQIRGWDGQDTVVVVPLELIDRALAYEDQLGESGERYGTVQILVTPGMPNPLGQVDHTQRRQVEIVSVHRTFADRETICRIHHFERFLPRKEEEITQAEYSFQHHSRIQQAYELFALIPDPPAIKSHGARPGIIAINENTLLLVMPMIKELPEDTPDWAYMQATPRFELEPKAPVRYGKPWGQPFADSTPEDLAGEETLAMRAQQVRAEQASNDATASNTIFQ